MYEGYGPNTCFWMSASYPAYIGKTKPPKWLCQDKIYKMLGHIEGYTGYEAYVLAGVDQETADFYRKGHMATLIGGKGFKEWVYEELLPELEVVNKGRIVQPDLSMIQVIKGVTSHYDILEVDITKRTKGPQQENKPRKMAMYLCQELSGAKLTEIVAQFNLVSAHPETAVSIWQLPGRVLCRISGKAY